MDDFPGLLERDFGFRAQGKAAPMAASKGTSGGNLNFGIGSGGDVRSSSFSSSSSRGKSSWNSTPVGSSFLDDDGLFRSSSSQKNNDFDGLGGYNDVYGGPPKYTNQADTRKSSTSFDYETMFQGTKTSSGAKSSSLPVYDKPVYDDDIFDGVPGMKSTSSVSYDDVFASVSSPPKQNDHFDDLLGNLGKNDPSQSNTSFRKNPEVSDFDDLLPGFGGSSPSKNRETPKASQPHQSTVPSSKSTSVMEDPFVTIDPGSVPAYESPEIYDDPLEQFNKPNKPNKPDNTNFNSSYGTGVFKDMDSLDDLAKSVPSFSSDMKNRVEDKNPLRTGANAASTRRAGGEEPTEEPFFKNASPKVEVSPKSEVIVDSADDIWITVSEVPLFTLPTSAPPPSRPPPPRPVQVSKADDGSLSSRNAKEKANKSSPFHHFSPSFQSPTTAPSSGQTMGVSAVDELEDIAMGRSRDRIDDPADALSSEEDVDTNSAAAAMKNAVDRAEAKFKHAREVRERESTRTGRSREAAQQEKDEKALRVAQELREKQERLDREREQREREEKEREQRRLEKERERARQVMERAQREARERAVAEARQKAHKEARERIERQAVQRAQAEARERAATEAKERLERAAVEAKERSNVEARERAAAVARAETEVRLRAERASVERAAAEARERAAAEAREKAAAAREHQQKNENDLESFFSMGARASSAPRPNRTTNSESAFDSQFQNRPVPEAARRTSPGTSSTIRKASSTTNIVDDLTSIFGGASPSGEFQDIDGESEDRRRARLERHQRTQERAAKALAEKNERDRQTQRDQAERHRIAETLDIEIKRWSAGKEGNLRALLSTLQYVLWPECGWQTVSLTDLITGAQVKKFYRKATLCIHPDKVQQKGANLQQKYIAEKVFDLLKEAWNKFNSEELF